MPENCENSCPGLTRLEQQVDDIRRQNGADHKEFRIQIQEMEKEDAKQKERFDRIMDNLHELKGDNKEMLGKLTPLTNKMDDVDKLSRDVDHLKSKPGKRWEGIVGQVIALAVAALVGLVLAKLGL